MIAVNLNGVWNMREDRKGERLQAVVPGSVASTLLAHGIIEDPYFGGNEKKIQSIFDKDYEFERQFYVDASLLEHDKVLLHCDGLDTLAEIFINDISVAKTANMHRTWVIDIKKHLRVGGNGIRIYFSSPIKYLKQHPSKTGRPFASIRKAACMFGWDWGLVFPDSGIWRDIYIETFDKASIDFVKTSQFHKNGKVTLIAQVQTNVYNNSKITAKVTLTSPDGSVIEQQLEVKKSQATAEFKIENPKLWWPVGYGEQPLYSLKTALCSKQALLDERKQQIGLRTIVLNRDKRSDGWNFGFVVNGQPIFFKGENLVIEDAIISLSTQERWDRLLDNCIRSNLNGIRVWGGAYFPPSYFYEQCDKLGLLVWQDMMFACTFYMPTAEFIENIRCEIFDNLKRIAHHPSLALICGNNEIESIYTVMCSKEPETVELRKLFGREKPVGLILKSFVWRIYKKLFLKVIPSICRKIAPQVSYSHSSPSTGKPKSAKSFYDYLTDGDMHYYLQYNGNAPYQKIRTVKCRFMAEMGFQSYPSLKTIDEFTNAEDRTPHSDIMYAHQKCKNGNETIELYMSRDYIVPSEFKNYVYLSQLQAGEIMKYSVEYLRRIHYFCNGVIIWQLNDCWPVVSWSGIDYYGRWKAQQYYTKRFYEPVLISANDEETNVGLWVTNDSSSDFEGIVSWSLNDNIGVQKKGEQEVSVQKGKSLECIKLDFSKEISQRNTSDAYLTYSLSQNGKTIGQGYTIFCLAKDFNFQKPILQVNIEETAKEYIIRISSDCFVKGLALYLLEGDCIFSDNFFDMAKDCEKCVFVVKTPDISGNSCKPFADNLIFTSLNEVIIKERNKTR